MEKLFQFTNKEAFDKILIIEKSNIHLNILMKSAFIVSQFIASVLCINIGFLFFNFKIPIKELLKIVFNSFIAVIIVELIIIGITKLKYSYLTISIIEEVEEKFYITNYINIDNIAPYLVLPLKTINTTHLLFILLLTYGISTLIKKNYFKSLLFTIKTYGIGICLWFVFATIMEMNFS